MSPIVYLGPTLSVEHARLIAPELEYRPPVRQGDVYRVVREGARMLGIVDGELDQALPVWHKELLWALAAGVRVFGAASMGALRAVELEPFGMIGIGEIYTLFRDGVLEDDDEVVVAHATSEFGHRSLSDAMVNVRATLELAVEQGALDGDVAAELTRRTKRLHYSERSFGALRTLCAHAEFASSTRRFLADLPVLATDVKSADAQLLLGRMRELHLRAPHPEARATPAITEFQFEPTSAWQAFLEYHTPTTAAGSDPQASASLLNAYHRALALEVARASGVEVSADDVQATSEAFRRARRLHDPQKAREWLESQQISLDGFSRLMRDEAIVHAASAGARTSALAQLPILEWLARPQQGDGDDT